MSYTSQYFPRRLFNKIVLSQFLFAAPIAVVVLVAAHLMVESRLPAEPESREILLAVDLTLVPLLVLLVLLLTLKEVWFARRLGLSLTRIIFKARQLSEKRDRVETDILDEEDILEEPGDISELESHLNKIGQSLLQTTELASREVSELEILMSNIAEAIIAVDRKGYPLFFNSRFAIFFGDDELQNRKRRLAEIIRNPDVLSAFNRVMSERKNETVLVELHRKNKSEDRFFSVSVAPLIHQGADEVYGAIGIFHDITKLKRADQIRIEFVSNVSHELRTPITSIKGYCETLRQDFQSGQSTKEDIDKYLDVIGRNVDRLLSLVNDLLDLSSIESGEEMHKEDIDVKELTGRVIRQLDRSRQNKKQNIKTIFGTEHILGDPKRIEQVLVNLVDNAIKYVQNGGEISVEWQLQGDRSVDLKVTDNGPGIPPSHIPRLFERFYRVDKARSREIGGTGLGLAIVKHIMQRHGGSVEAHSEVGKGTEFICHFPYN